MSKKDFQRVTDVEGQGFATAQLMDSTISTAQAMRGCRDDSQTGSLGEFSADVLAFGGFAAWKKENKSK